MKRFAPLDILRGLTVLLMIIVNHPGSWSHIYPVLEHSAWDGVTLADLVFPTFVFCCGMAMAFSLAKFDGLGGKALAKILRRGALLILIGIVVHAFPFNGWEHVRIPGVLQRIGLCYVLGGVLILGLKKPVRLWVSFVLMLAAYTAALLLFGEQGAQLTLEGNVTSRIDIALFGADHIYHGYGTAFDPEGLLGTLPATCTLLLGWFAGQEVKEGCGWWKVLVAGAAALAAGLLVSIWIPLNKPLWSASYVLYCAGWSGIILGLIMLLTGKGRVKAFTPAVAFGSNALFAYVLSELLGSVPGMLGFDHEAVCDTPAKSLVYAILFTSVFFVLNLVLYKKKVFIKI